MRTGILLLFISLFCSTIHALLIDEVYQNNLGIASQLDNSFISNFSKQSSVSFYSATLPVSASFAFVAFDPSIDNRFHATSPNQIIFAWGTNQSQHLPAIGHSGYCTAAECCIGTDCTIGEQCSYYCDYDNDNCVEYENKSYSLKSAQITFCFRNECQTTNTSSNAVSVPDILINQMKNSSGIENLSIEINATISVIYEMNDRYPAGANCHSNTTIINRNFNFYEKKIFMVEGDEILFFLAAPVLREQWYKNNHFDSVVLSTGKLSSFSIYMNNNISKNFTLYSLNKSTDFFGAQHILSYLNETNGVSESISNILPVSLQEQNQTFGYAYRINHSYEGIGQNNLSLLIVSQFNNEAIFNETILSRMLCHSNQYTETGASVSSVDPDSVRKSASFSSDSLTVYIVAIGSIVFLIIVVFINRIWKS